MAAALLRPKLAGDGSLLAVECSIRTGGSFK